MEDTIISLIAEQEKLWLFSYDTIFTVLATLLITFITIWANQYSKKQSNLKNSKKIFNLVNHHIDELIKGCDKIISHYDKYANEKITLKLGTGPTSPKVTSIGLNRLRETPYKDTFFSFRDKTPLDNIFSKVDHIDSLLKHVDFHHQVFYEAEKIKRENIDCLLFSYRNNTAEYLVTILNHCTDEKGKEVKMFVNKTLKDMVSKEEKNDFIGLIDCCVKNLHLKFVEYHNYYIHSFQTYDQKLHSLIVEGKEILNTWQWVKCHFEVVKKFYLKRKEEIQIDKNTIEKEREKLQWKKVSWHRMFFLKYFSGERELFK